jgi:hypothetical protein
MTRFRSDCTATNIRNPTKTHRGKSCRVRARRVATRRAIGVASHARGPRSHQTPPLTTQRPP